MSKRGHGEICAYCKRRLEATTSPSRLAATRDHVHPKSRATPMSRIYGVGTVWCCRLCNSLKANLLPDEWANFMVRNPQWWTRDEFRHGGLRLRRRARETAPILAKNANGPLPVEQTLAILREGVDAWRAKYSAVPVEYDDPAAQAAFEAVYRERLHMLRLLHGQGARGS